MISGLLIPIDVAARCGDEKPVWEPAGDVTRARAPIKDVSENVTRQASEDVTGDKPIDARIWAIVGAVTYLVVLVILHQRRTWELRKRGNDAKPL